MKLDAVTIVIPFRLASRRFPRKALCSFRGKTLLEHAVANASALGGRRVVVTAPAEDLEEARPLLGTGATVVPSSVGCASATERIVEIFPQLDGELVLSLPVDEPSITPASIRAALAAEDDPPAGATTFYCAFRAPEDYLSPLSAKVIVDQEGRLLYMSRAVIPVTKDGSVAERTLKKNVGAFLFRRSFLQELARLADVATVLDRCEGLEQLRWLELGLGPVRCLPIEHAGFGIDVPEQLAALEERIG